MAERFPSKPFPTHRSRKTLYTHPVCEYCGQEVYPGEAQNVDHDFLCWHRGRCFRCFGCHREFSKKLRCNLMHNMVLCDDCHLRRAFFHDQWISYKLGERADIKQHRVFFSSPVEFTETSKSNSSCESATSSEESPIGLAANYEYGSRVTALPESGKTLEKNWWRFQGQKAKKNRGPHGFPAFAGRAPSNASGASRGATAAKKNVPRTSVKRVEKQIAGAMASTAGPSGVVGVEIEVPTQSVENGVVETSGSPSASSKKTIRVDVSKQLDGSDPPVSEGKTDENEIVHVDGKFDVVAVGDWCELVAGGSPETEQTEREDSSAASDSQLVSACEMQPDTAEVAAKEAGSTHSGLRRSSSCSNLYETARASTSRNDPPQEPGDSRHLECLFGLDVVCTVCTMCKGREDEYVVRHAEPSSTPSPVPQSSTPVPLNALNSSGNGRPPSALSDDKVWAQTNHSTTKTISVHDASLGENHDDKSLHSFQERRAIFQSMSTNEKNAACTVCKEQLYQHERLEILNRSYHTRCFGCARCSVRLSAITFCDDGENPYCKTCFKDMKISRNHFPKSPSRNRVNSM